MEGIASGCPNGFGLIAIFHRLAFKLYGSQERTVENMFSFDDSAAAETLADSAREFIDEVVIPAERDHPAGEPVSPSTIDELQSAAREYGVYAPQVSEEFGGLGYDFADVLPTFEQAGRSMLGSIAMRVDAPDEGNMHLLELAGTDEQKSTYLEYLVAGEIRSAIAMTEPLQGAGSDPKMIQTTATREVGNGDRNGGGKGDRNGGGKGGGEWVLNGHKWWTTNGSHADVFFVFARTDEDVHPYEGCSILIVPADAEGVTIERDIPHLGSELHGAGHAEVTFENVRVPEENLLGKEGMGFLHVQQRLGPARLTHCMRFSGMAMRALSIARAYLDERQAFGSALADKQYLRFRIAEMETRLQAARALVRQAASAIAAGQQARLEVAMCKVFTARVTQEAIDTAVQCCGGNGIGKDLPLADFYESVRAFRIVDGADEVHLRTIARELFDEVDSAELEVLTRFGEPNRSFHS